MSGPAYQELLSKFNSAEKEVKEIKNEIERLKRGEVGVEEDEFGEELTSMMADNKRLKYQAEHLQRNIAEEAKSQKYCPDILKLVTNLFDEAISSAFPGVCKNHVVVVTPSTQEKYGDYQCNSAMTLTKLLTTATTKSNPRQVASSIVEHIPANELIQKTEIAGAGFINVFLSHAYVCEVVRMGVVEGVKPSPPFPCKRVVIDFSSPNIAKEMHVGHLRSTIIGESISRLFTFLGHTTIKLNHLGDWGTQFGMLITHLVDKFPNYLHQCPPIGDLQAFYKESKARFDADDDFKKRAYAAVVKLQSYDDDTTKAWNMICDASKQEFSKIYKRFKIEGLMDRGESFYQTLMEKVVEELAGKGMLVEDEGRKILWPKGCSIPLTIVKSDGGFTYDTSDMTALKHRLEVEKADEILYVIDAGQSTHIQGFFQGGVDAGWYDPKKVRVAHIGFGVVLGEDRKKFKTRSGDTVRLVDLLDEGVKRADDKLRTKGRHEILSEEELRLAKEAVAYGCIKYADLSHCRTNDYVFSFDKMLDDKGNTAVYLQYAYMRIRSINRLISITRDQLINHGTPTFGHEKEWKLAKLLCRFTEVLNRCVVDFYIHTLCDYLYEVATTFTEFYDVCYVVEKDRNTGAVIKVDMNRLMLCEMTSEVLKQGFSILGIDTVEKM